MASVPSRSKRFVNCPWKTDQLRPQVLVIGTNEIEGTQPNVILCDELFSLYTAVNVQSVKCGGNFTVYGSNVANSCRS